MKRVLVLALTCLGLISKPSAAQRDGGRQRATTRYGWRLDYDEAKAEARKDGKPLMVVIRCVP